MVPAARPPAEWPAAGQVVFSGVRMRYAPGLPEVLRGVSFTLAPGEKVGVVGRTGAGKSSLVTALFRLVELKGGSVTIDGRDCGAMGLQDLRSRVGIITQDAVVFTGTVRVDGCGGRTKRV